MSYDEQNQTTTALAIASSAENVGAIIRATPESFLKNQGSHDRCLRNCEALLAEIKEHGMNDELDKKAAVYIERTRRTIKDMNDVRSPVTKLFDMVRSEFTKLENEIDPAKADTIPYQIQQYRNQYAAKKREEEELRRRAEEVRRQAEIARETYKNACIEDYKSSLNTLIVSRLNELTEINGKVTLDNYTAIFDTVNGFSTEIPDNWCPPSCVRMPFNLSAEESKHIRTSILLSLMPQFSEQYRSEISDYRQEILDRLPSKKVELERAAKASAAEAERIQAEIRQREAAELARKEQERISREQEEAKKAEVSQAGQEAANLFEVAAASQSTYQPKSKVTKRIRIVRPEGYMQVLSMWWALEGCRMTEDELSKVFKKQITFCEKVANKDGRLINDGSVEYIDEVKAQ